MEFTSDLADVGPEQLDGFFTGWPKRPSPQRHLEILRGSAHFVLARDATGQVEGFVTAITDGGFAAYIPLLEVRPDARGQGVGSELVRRMLRLLDGYYMVDVICDDDALPFYERAGFTRYHGAIRRTPAAIR
ncbi:MAG: GNAT family N-acetyltransferase [Acidothermaceae bacterium]